MDLLANTSSDPTPQGSPDLEVFDDHDTTGIESAPLSGLALSLQQCFTTGKKVKVDEDRERTENFFYCLAFRLGQTMVGLENIAQLIEDADSLRRTLRQQSQGQGQGGLASVSDIPFREEQTDAQPGMTYRDLVNQIDPDRLKETPDETIPVDRNLTAAVTRNVIAEEHCKRIVHRNIARAAYENHTMLWPVVRTLGTGQTGSSGANGEGITVRRREALWSFAHPSKRFLSPVPCYWSLDRWPLHLQTKDLQEQIRTSGPKLMIIEELEQEAQEQQLTNPMTLEYAQTYAQAARRRQSFHPGPPTFWAGDTPLQRKAIERSVRDRKWQLYIETLLCD